MYISYVIVCFCSFFLNFFFSWIRVIGEKCDKKRAYVYKTRIKYVIMKNKCCHDINKMWWCAVPCFEAVDMEILCGFFFVCVDIFYWCCRCGFTLCFRDMKREVFSSRYCRFLLCQWLWQNALLFYHEFSSFATTTSTTTKITKIMFVYSIFSLLRKTNRIFFYSFMCTNWKQLSRK